MISEERALSRDDLIFWIFMKSDMMLRLTKTLFFVSRGNRWSIYSIRNPTFSILFQKEEEEGFEVVDARALSDTLIMIEEDSTQVYYSVYSVLCLETERFVLPERYRVFKKITDTLYRIEQPLGLDDKNHGMFSTESGSLVVPAEFRSIVPCTETLFMVGDANGKIGIYSSETKSLIVPFIYEEVYPLTDTLFEVRDCRNTKVGVYSTKTGEVEWK